ncbi:MAG: succinate dehydrogenase cytochrome b subunit [Deltaproteobacteria bacterium]|nr:succinate dehydrogenase cytochrome b subunit [Deltaproteobacteria bacterium]
MANQPGSLTSVGKKILIALTGMGLMLFLAGHVSGNLLIFVGDETFNNYGHTLVSNPFIYVIEFGMLAIFLFHLFTALANWMNNRDARGKTRYYSPAWATGGKSRKSFASTSMILTGAVLIVFVILHVGTMKFGWGYTITETPEGIRDLATQMRAAFSSPLVVLAYEVVMVLVGMHLWHGFSSAFQSLGVSHPKLEKVLQPAGWLFAIFVGGGFLAIPFALYLNLF